MKTILLSVCGLLLAIHTIGQSFELTGQVRPRAEYKHGYKSLIGEDIDPATAISQRTRLGLGYQSDKIKAMVTLQDVRIWGDVATSNRSDLNGTMLYQAWGEFLLHKTLSVKAGRQPILHDDQRLFGGNDWSQQARSHDALLLKYNPAQNITFHAGFAFNQSSDKDTGTFYTLEKNHKALQYLHMHADKGKSFGASILLVNLGMPYNEMLVDSTWKQETNFFQTLGGIINYNPDKIKSSLAFYYQTGKNQKNKNKSAYFIGADFSYSPDKNWTLGTGFQYLTGNDQVSPDNKDHEFSTLFSNGHKFNGWMDYFNAGSSHKGVGLLDVYLPLIYKKEKFSAEMQFHYFRSAASVKDPAKDATKAMDSYLGSEGGILLSYALSSEITISGGYSQMFGTETLEAIKGGDRKVTQNWIWTMFTFNPVFIKVTK